MTFRECTESCKHHHNPKLAHFYCLKKTLPACLRPSLFPPPALSSCWSVFHGCRFAFSGQFFIIYGLLCLTSFTEHVFWVSSMYQGFWFFQICSLTGFWQFSLDSGSFLCACRKQCMRLGQRVERSLCKKLSGLLSQCKSLIAGHYSIQFWHFNNFFLLSHKNIIPAVFPSPHPTKSSGQCSLPLKLQNIFLG